MQASSINSATGLITNKRSIESNVLVDDGQIVVLGGLLQDEYSGNQDKVPVLGDMPFFGNLFGRDAQPQQDQPDGVPAAGGRARRRRRATRSRWTATT